MEMIEKNGITIPRKLYKYLPDRENIFPLALRYSPPQILNDYYEVFPNLVAPTADQLEKFARENGLPNSREQLEELAREFEEEYKEKAFSDFKKFQEDNHIGILSLTVDPASLVMWGIYASEHKGIVVELDMGHDLFWPDKDSFLFRPVRYAHERPKATFDISINNIKEWLLTKSIEWSFEKEYRSITTIVHQLEAVPGKSGTFRVPPDAISAVYLGLRTEGEFLKSVTNYCKICKIPCERMKRHPSEYKLILPKPGI